MCNDLMGEKRKKFLSSFQNKSRTRKGIGDNKGTCNRCSRKKIVRYSRDDGSISVDNGRCGGGILRNALTHARELYPSVVGRESTSRRFMQTAVYAARGARHPTETRSNPKMHDWKTSTALLPLLLVFRRFDGSSGRLIFN